MYIHKSMNKINYMQLDLSQVGIKSSPRCLQGLYKSSSATNATISREGGLRGYFDTN
jgi:hypothetical protein